MTLAAMPLPGGAEMPRRVLALHLSRVSKELLIQLHCWRYQRRRIDPSVETLARLVQATPRTVQRHLAELCQAGLVVRVYNGGRARRCIYYVGAKAAELAAQEPAWIAPCRRKNRPGGALGSLRLGRVAQSRKDDKIVILKADHSSSVERSDRDQEVASVSAGGGLALREMAPGTIPPPPPQAGGTGELSAGRCPLPGSQTTTPPRPPKGGKSLGEKGSTPRAKARTWDRHPELWRAAWGLWRDLHQAFRRRELVPDIRDAVAMAGLIDQALFATRQNFDEALRYLGWGFRRHLRFRPDEPLWKLRRVRNEYGFPLRGWTVPTREDLAKLIRNRGSSAGGGGSSSSTSTPNHIAPADAAKRARAALEQMNHPRK